MENNPISVSLVNHYIKDILESDYRFKHILVTGEISNLKKHFTGHWYFTLKDEDSRISAVMFASNASKVKEDIKDGTKVIATASLGVYEKTGTYQLYVSKLELVGSGTLFEQFEKLKKKLNEEGLFDESHKVAIPKFASNIGVITAAKGAAIRDIITTVQRRWPYAQLTLLPSLVQGDGAKESLCDALVKADQMGFDVIIFGRGGGSIEDLWPFNEEMVARQLYKMKTPVISGVGHEIDFTISDFVADVRAATPTAAAELATPNRLDVIRVFEDKQHTMLNIVSKAIKQAKSDLDHYKDSKVLKFPESLFETKEYELNTLKQSLLSSKDIMIKDISHRLSSYKQDLFKSKDIMFHDMLSTLKQKEQNISHGFSMKLEHNNNKFMILSGKLNTLSPLNILSRGYGITTKEGSVIESISKLKVNDQVKVRLKDGSFTANVISKEDK